MLTGVVGAVDAPMLSTGASAVAVVPADLAGSFNLSPGRILSVVATLGFSARMDLMLVS